MRWKVLLPKLSTRANRRAVAVPVSSSEPRYHGYPAPSLCSSYKKICRRACVCAWWSASDCLHACARVHVCLFVFACGSVCVYAYALLNASQCLPCTCLCVLASVCVCVSVCICVRVWAYVSVCVCVRVCVCQTNATHFPEVSLNRCLSLV